MKRAAVLLVLSLVVASCATMQSPGQSHVSRAVTALGGADALGSVTSHYERGTVKQWEPEQSMTPGGEMRFMSESIYEAITDLGRRTTSIDWSRKFAYPFPRHFVFNEVIAPEVGYVAGIDAVSRTKQSIEALPPGHNMSGLRLATAHRELRRASPVLLLEMLKNPARVADVPDVTVGGAAHPAVEYRVAPNQAFTVMFDRASGLPARIRTLDYDSIWGDVNYDLVLGDWQTIDKVKVPMTRKYELGGRTVMETKISSAAFNTAFAADRLAIPESFRAGASKPATGPVPYQWVIRRQFGNTYLDSDVPSFDTRATTGLKLAQLAPGVLHVVGGSHNALIVEMQDHLVVFDAPINDWQSTWVLAAAHNRYPKKPVKYLVLTHHHIDHAGGFRAFAAEGATLVVGQGTAAHYRKALASPFTRNPDLPSKDLSKTPVVEVADKHVLSDGKREVHAYLLPNPHADGLLIGYVADARLGYVTDVWSPGAGALPDKITPPLAALVAGVKKAGITPEKFAGGHGTVADYAPLAALEGK